MKTLSPLSRCQRAFTLIELLTVIAIIGILAAIIIPTVGRVRESAKRSQCLSNVRQLGMAMGMFANDNKGKLPPMFTSTTQTWAQYLVDGNYVKKTADIFKCPSDNVNNAGSVIRDQPNVVIRSYAYNNFVGLRKLDGTDFNPPKKGWICGTMTKVTKPWSQTILLADGAYNLGAVNHSDGIECSNFSNCQAPHRNKLGDNNGANYVFMDMHARWMPFADTPDTQELLERHWYPTGDKPE